MTKEQRISVQRTVTQVRDALEATAQARLRESLARGAGRERDAEMAGIEAEVYGGKAKELVEHAVQTIKEVTP